MANIGYRNILIIELSDMDLEVSLNDINTVFEEEFTLEDVESLKVFFLFTFTVILSIMLKLNVSSQNYVKMTSSQSDMTLNVPLYFFVSDSYINNTTNVKMNKEIN